VPLNDPRQPEYYAVNQRYSMTRDTGKIDTPPTNETPVAKPSVGNVAKYLSAEASLQLHGPVSDDVFAERKAQCVACPNRVLSDQLPDEIGYCRACGCGVSERSRLTVKLTMPAATCPAKRWQPAEGRHRSVIDRAKSWAARKLLGA
jgi:hypothetical protein